MKQHSLKKTELVSFVIASALGVLFHFMYEWTGENAIAGLFFPINESTWEHLKLIFFPWRPPISAVTIGFFPENCLPFPGKSASGGL